MKNNINSVFILIPVFNRLTITKQGLNAIYSLLSSYSNNSTKFKVVIIDDGSTDGTTEWVKENYPTCIILHGDGNLWWSGGINVGAKYAMKHGASHILLWNDDIKPSKDYFSKLANVIENNVIIGSVVFDVNTGKKWFMGAKYFPYLGLLHHIKNDNTKFKINCLTGMGTLIPMQIATKLNFWDNKSFPQYYGDIDFTLRAYENGIKIVVSEELKIYNDTRTSSFNQEKSLKKYWRSLFIIQSRYNLKIEIEFHKKHAKLFTWRIGFYYKEMKYLIQSII